MYHPQRPYAAQPIEARCEVIQESTDTVYGPTFKIRYRQAVRLGRWPIRVASSLDTPSGYKTTRQQTGRRLILSRRPVSEAIWLSPSAPESL